MRSGNSAAAIAARRRATASYIGKGIVPPQGGGGYTPSQIIATGQDGIGVAGGWGVSNGVLSLDNSDVRRPGQAVLKATATAGAAVNMTIRRKISALQLTGPIDVWVKQPKVSAGTMDIFVGWSGTAPGNDPPSAAPANNRQMFIATTERADGIWNCYRLLMPQKNYATGRPQGRDWFSTEALPSTIQYIEIFVQVSATVPDAERTLAVDQIAINGKANLSRFAFVFDGFDATLLSAVAPIFDSHGWKGCIVGGGDLLAANKSTIDALIAKGWKYGTMGMNHTDYGLNSSNLAADIATSNGLSIAAGYGAADVFAYPNNSRSAATDAILAANGITAATGQGPGESVRSNLGNTPRLAIGRMMTDQQTAATMMAWTAAAIAAGADMVIGGHKYVAASGSNVETTLSEFTTYAADLRAKEIAGQAQVVPFLSIAA